MGRVVYFKLSYFKLTLLYDGKHFYKNFKYFKLDNIFFFLYHKLSFSAKTIFILAHVKVQLKL